MPLLAQQIEIDIGQGELARGREALGLGQCGAVLEDRGLTVPGEVGGGLAGSRRGVQIGRQAARRLGRTQQPPRLRLADRDVAGRQIGEHGRTRQRGAASWAAPGPRCPRRSRHAPPGPARPRPRTADRCRTARSVRRPRSPHPPCRRPPRNAAVRRTRGSWAGGPSARRPAAAAMDRERAVVQRAGMAQRRANQQQRQQISRRRDEFGDSLLHRIEQRGLVQQIADRVARDAEFREHRQCRASGVARRAPRQGLPRHSPPDRRACSASYRRQRGRSRGGRSSETPLARPSGRVTRFCYTRNMVHGSRGVTRTSCSAYAMAADLRGPVGAARAAAPAV